MLLNRKEGTRASAARIGLFAEEPFRIFFPIGSLLGAVGVSLWLLYYSGAIITYPGIAHARLMIEGFMASFMFGFLGTAGPRITSAPRFSFYAVMLVLTLQLLAAGLHTGGAHQAGDSCFTLGLLIFAVLLARRFVQRRDSPPPNFALVALGLLTGIIGAALVSASEAAQYSFLYRFGTALLNQTFVLLPMMGVAPFFIRKLLELPGPELPESRELPPAWKRQAIFAIFAGLVIIGSELLDIYGLVRMGPAIRASVVFLYLATRLPLRGQTFLANCMRFGLLFLAIGFVLMALFPDWRVGALHLLFITGFSSVVFTVASRVVFGHSGNAHLFGGRLPFLIIANVLLFLAMLSRLSADMAPPARTLHLLAAAILWLAALSVWAAKVLPKTMQGAVED